MSYVLPMIVQLLRHRAELTQAALATRVGVSPSAVTQAENITNGMQERIFAGYATALGLSEAEALRDGLALLERMDAGETLEDLFPHLLPAAEAKPEREGTHAPPKAGKPSKIHRRAKVTAPAAAPPKRGPSKIRQPKRGAKKAAAKSKPRARA